MGWAGGTEVCEDIWDVVRIYIPKKERVEVLALIIEKLTDKDWDTTEEISDLWPEAIEALKLSGNWSDEDDETT